jgi:hypothetical protein
VPSTTRSNVPLAGASMGASSARMACSGAGRAAAELARALTLHAPPRWVASL